MVVYSVGSAQHNFHCYGGFVKLGYYQSTEAVLGTPQFTRVLHVQYFTIEALSLHKDG